MGAKGRNGRKNLNRSTESSKPRASLNLPKESKKKKKRKKKKTANSHPIWSWGSGVRDQQWENQVGNKQGAIVLGMT